MDFRVKYMGPGVYPGPDNQLHETGEAFDAPAAWLWSKTNMLYRGLLDAATPDATRRVLIAGTASYLDESGEQVAPYTPFEAREAWLLKPAQFSAVVGAALVEVDAYAQEVGEASPAALAVMCRRRGMADDGAADEMRAMLLEGVVAAEPSREARIAAAIEADDYNDMRSLLAELSEESIGRPSKAEVIEMLYAKLEE